MSSSVILKHIIIAKKLKKDKTPRLFHSYQQ